MAKKSYSEKDILELLDFGQGLSSKFLSPVEWTDNGMEDFLSSVKYKNANQVLNKVLPGGEDTDPYDQTEEVLFEDDSVYRTYNVWRDKKTGNIVRKSLIDGVEGVKFEQFKEKGSPLDIASTKNRLFEYIRGDIDPKTGELKRKAGKTFLDNALDNSLTYQLGRVASDIMGGDKNIGRFGGGLFDDKVEWAFMNNLDIKQDGIYYKGQKIVTDSEQANLVAEWLGEKTTYDSSGFTDSFLNTATTFIIDAPLFYVAGRGGGSFSKALLPGLSNATSLPGRLINHFVRTNATLSLAETPAIIKHTQEGGLNAFVEDLKHTAEFSLYASVFGTAGDYVGGGISKLLNRGKNLTSGEAIKFFKRNPQITQQLSTGFTSGMLGYSTTDGSTEDKLATGLTFAALHFSNTEAWKGYLKGENKRVVVEKDSFDKIVGNVKKGNNLLKSIKEVGATTPRYFIEEKNQLFEIDGNKFVNKGTVEKLAENPITLTPENSKGFNYITEAVPFYKKTLKQAWQDEELRELKVNVFKDIGNSVKNPFNEKTERDDYLGFELNKSITASHLGDMIYSNKLNKAFRNNSLPEDIKLKSFVSKTSEYFNLPPQYFERHLKSAFVNYIKDPKGFKESEFFKFLPEEYQKQFEKGLFNIDNAIEATLTKAQVDKVFKFLDFEEPEVSYGGIEELKPKTEDIDLLTKPPVIREQAEGIKLKPKPTEEKGILETKFQEMTNVKRKNVGLKKKPSVEEIDINSIKSFSDLNEAFEKVDNPKELYDKIKTSKKINEEKVKAKEKAETKANIPSPEEELKATIERAGGVFKGVQKTKGKISRVLIESPKYGTTRYVRTEGFTEEKAKQEIGRIEKEYQLSEELKSIQEKLHKEGKTEEEITAETYDKPESEAGKKLQEILAFDMEKHALEMEERVPVEGEKAIKLESGEIISSPEIKSHLDFAKVLSKEQIGKIVDTGYVDKEGNFVSTKTVPTEAFREALNRLSGTKSLFEEPTYNPFANLQTVKDLATVGAELFERGLRTFAEWSKEMIQTLGTGIKNFLSKIWNVTSQYLTGERAILNPNTLLSIGGGELGKQPKTTGNEGTIEKQGKGLSMYGEGEKSPQEVVYGSSVRDNEGKPFTPEQESKLRSKSVKLLERYKPKKKSGRLTGTTLTPEEYSSLRDIRSVSEMKTEEVTSNIDKLISHYNELETKRAEKTTEEYESTEDLLNEAMYNLLTFGDLTNKSGEKLKQANEEIKNLIEFGRTKHQEIEMARKERRDNLRKMAKESIGYEVLTEEEARSEGISKEGGGFAKNISEWVYNFDSQNLGLEHLLKKISNKNDNFANHIIRQTKLAGNKENQGNIYWQKTLEDKLHEIYKVDSKWELNKVIAKNKERVKESGVFVKQGDKEIQVELSQNEAYKKWQEWQRPQARAGLEGQGYTEETFNQLEKFISPETRDWAEWQLKEFYPEYYKGINEVFRRMTYVDLPYDEFYTPLERDVSGFKQDPTFLNPTSPYATVFNNHLKSVVKSKAALKYIDGDEAISSHIAQMERFKAWAETIRELRGVFGERDLRTIIKQRYGGETVGILDRFVDDLARGSIDRGKIFPTIDKFRNNFTRAVLGLNPTLLPKQLSSFPAYAIDIPVSDFMSGMVEALSNPKKAHDILMEADFMKSRYEQGFDRDIKDALSKKTSQKLAGARSISDALFTMVKLGDKAALLFGGYPVYKYHLNKGLAEGKSQEEAHREALLQFQLSTERAQQSSKIEDMAEIQRTGGSLGKLFTMFISQPNQYYRLTSSAVRDLIRKKGDPAQHIKTIAIAHFALPMLFQFIADGFNFRRDRQIRAGLLGSLNGLFIVGDILQAGMAGITGDWHFAIQGTPLIDAPDNIVKAFDKIGKLEEDGEIDSKEVFQILDKLASGTSKFTGIPYDPARRITEGVVESFDEDKFTLKTLGFGDVALRETQDAMKEAKKQKNIYYKLYQKNPNEENRTTYLEYKREYERLVRELKKKNKGKEK